MVKNRHYYKDEIKKMLIVYTLTVLFISILSLALFTYVYSNKLVRDNNIDANKEIAKSLELSFSAYLDYLNDEDNIKDILAFLRHDLPQKGIFESLYSLNNSSDMKSIFYIVDINGNTLLTNTYSQLPYDKEELISSPLFKELDKSDNIVFMNQKIQVDRSMRTIYSIARRVSYDNTNAYIIFDIPEKYILNLIYSKSFDIFALTDKYGNDICSSNQMLLDDIGKLKFRDSSFGKIDFLDNKYFIYSTNVLDDNLCLYTFSKISLIHDILRPSLIFTIFFIIVFSILIFIASEYFAKKKTSSVDELMLIFGRVMEGDLSARVKLNTGDEFEEIGDEFNSILDEFNKQIAVNDKLNEMRKIAVIKHLESQFNPHFIFNTLEVLKYLIHIDKAKSADLIINFASLLRYSIDYPDRDVSLEEDLEYIEMYLEIQKLRYNKRLNYEITFLDDLKDVSIPKLILQPIIENCIVHGYKNKTNLNIEIDISRVEKTLFLSVLDDGDGIDEKCLNEILYSLENEEGANNHLGVRNVYRRIKMMYGEPYGIDITSKKGAYTKVVLKLPYNRSEVDV